MKIEKREISVKSNHKKQSLGTFICVSIVLQVLFFVLLLIINCHFTYSVDNYRYIYSSLLQIIGSMFAFIASSTLVAYQFLSSFSPMSTMYYPKTLFISFLVITLTIIGFDVLAICLLKGETDTYIRYIYDFFITLNVYPLTLALHYVLFVINSIAPQNQLDKIVEKAKKADTNKERLNVIYSLEEMCLSAIRNGQGGYIRSCQDKFHDIINIYSTSHTELNKNSIHHPDNPLRTIPDIIERITYSMIDNNMQNLVHFNGHILRELSGARCNGKRIVGVEIASAIESIGIYCIEKRRITDIKNFIANAVYCIDKDNSASTMLWGCELLIKTCQNYIADHPRETLAVIEEILTCIDYAIKNNEVRPKNGVLIIDFLLKQR